MIFMLDFKARATNYIFWIGVLSFVLLISKDFGYDLGMYKVVANHILEFLVFLGILNNPASNSAGLSDK